MARGLLTVRKKGEPSPMLRTRAGSGWRIVELGLIALIVVLAAVFIYRLRFG